jgi:hypothetical protein
MAAPLLIPILIAGSAGIVGSVAGWSTRGVVEDIKTPLSTATGSLNTIQLMTILGIMYMGYKFVKEL